MVTIMMHKIAFFFIVYTLWTISSQLPAQQNYYLDQFPEDIRISGFIDGAYGSRIAIGDVNGDGYQDIVASGYSFDRSRGGVVITFGKPDWPRHIDLETYPDRTIIWGNSKLDYTGSGLAVIDFTGDGIDDIFIASAQYTKNPRKGKVFFLEGRRNWPDEMTVEDFPTSDDAATFHGPEKFSYLGEPIASGNFDGDAYGDVVLGYSRWRDSVPTLYTMIVWGGQKLSSGIIDTLSLNQTTIISPSWYDGTAGYHVSRIDEDRKDELIIAMIFNPVDSLKSAGNIFVIWGQRDRLGTVDLSLADSLVEVTYLKGNKPSMQLSHLFEIADFDQNGVMDLFLSTESNRISKRGQGVIAFDAYPGDETNLNIFSGKSTFIFNPRTYYGGAYLEYAEVLDWNHDGYPDIVITDAGAGRQNVGRGAEGMVYCLYGRESFQDSIFLGEPDSGADIIWGGETVMDLGSAVTKADIDADGKDDLIIGAPLARTKAGWGMGEVYVFYNRSKEKAQTPPDRYDLLSTYPNPASDYVRIQLNLEKAENVEVVIYNTLGQEVARLKQEAASPGVFSMFWDGYTKENERAAAGLYFLVLKSENQSVLAREKMVFLR